MPTAAGGFPKTPLNEEFETQEVSEQLYICEVLYVGLKRQHAALHKWCQDKSRKVEARGCGETEVGEELEFLARVRGWSEEEHSERTSELLVIEKEAALCRSEW